MLSLPILKRQRCFVLVFFGRWFDRLMAMVELMVVALTGINVTLDPFPVVRRVILLLSARCLSHFAIHAGGRNLLLLSVSVFAIGCIPYMSWLILARIIRRELSHKVLYN